MSASIIAYLPGITEEQEESQWAEFNNDYQDWANWMAEGLQEPQVVAAMERAGVLPLANMTTEGSPGDPLPPYLQAVDVDAAGSGYFRPR